MAFSELEQKRIEKALDSFVELRRPPAHIRPQLDIGYRQNGQSIELVEIRPAWDDPNVILEHPFAKATYVKTQNVWRVFWRRADLKWHGYPPASSVKTIVEFLDIVNRDEHACFFG
jgi:hypothetical protein